MFQSQRTQKKLEKDVANRKAQEEKLQVKYSPKILDGELLIMQISSFPSVRGFSSLHLPSLTFWRDFVYTVKTPISPHLFSVKYLL